MAKIKLANLSPRALTSVLGGIVIHDTKNGAVVQKRPRKRTTPRSGGNFFRTKQFGIAGAWASSPDPVQYVSAIQHAEGTSYVPRDILMRASYGTLYNFTGPPGWDLRNDKQVNGYVQDILDQLGATRNSVIVRASIGWINVTPDTAGQVLLFDGTDVKWRQPSTQLNASASMFHLNANQNIATGTWVDVLWTTSDADPLHILSASDHKTFTIPAGASLARVSLYTCWLNTSVGNRYSRLSNITTGTDEVLDIRAAQNEAAAHATTPVFKVTPGQQYILRVNQTTGSTISLSGDSGSNFGKPSRCSWEFF